MAVENLQERGVVEFSGAANANSELPERLRPALGFVTAFMLMAIVWLLVAVVFLVL